jgi:hypothetical protein
MQRLRLECTGLRHDNATVTRERDSLLKENISLRKGEHHRQREADLRWREATQEPAVAALRRRLETSEQQLRLAQMQISSLELQCSLLRMAVRDGEPGTLHQGATVPRGEIAQQLRELIRLCHPDKWHDAEVATELTKHLNRLRAEYAV